MKSFAFMSAMCCALLWGCADTGTEFFPQSTLVGQVYSIGWPGPVPEGWTAPPLEQVVAVEVRDLELAVVAVAKTDAKGHFVIPIAAGHYTLRVKESPVPVQTGPFDVRSGECATAVAYYDNGMR